MSRVGELTGERGPVEVKVSSIALDSVFTIGPDADLGKAADLMLDRTFPRSRSWIRRNWSASSPSTI